jgi:solute carrier family 25 protein 38
LTLKSSSANGKINPLNLRKFWTGVTPSLLRSAPVAGIYFGSVDFLRYTESLSHSQYGGKYQLIHSFLIGTISRVVADTGTHPLNLIKTRFESDYYSYNSVRDAVRIIYKEEGFFGLYKGLSATLIRDISYSGLYYALYTKIKYEFKQDGSKTNSLFFASCALLSSALACGLTQPPDVIRSYIQLNCTKYKSIPSTIDSIYKNHGVRGFFSGFLPRSSRRILISVMSWTIFEKLSLKKA